MPRGAPRADEDGVVPLVEQRLQALDVRAVADVDAHAEDHVDLVVEHLSGRRKDGMFERISPPGTGSFSKIVTA